MSMIVTGLLGEHFCMRREMEDISVDQIVTRRGSQPEKHTKKEDNKSTEVETRNGASAAAASGMPYSNGVINDVDLKHNQMSDDQRKDVGV